MSWASAGTRVFLCIAVLIGTIVLVGQILNDPLQAFYFDGVSEIVGLTTFLVWKVDVNSARAKI